MWCISTWRRRLSAALLCLAPVAGAHGQNWPSFRGPNASGIADGLELPSDFAPDSAAWSTELPGLGHSSPVVWGDRVFVTTAVSDDPDAIFIHGLDGKIDRRSDTSAQTYWVYCLDRVSGELLWKREAARGVPKIQRHRKNSYASPTPATDGERLVVYFGSEGLHAYDLDGERLWSRDLGVVDAGASYDDTYDWGPASSPILHDGSVFQLVDQQGGSSFLLAVDAETGETRWRVDREVISSFSTPAIYEGEKGTELVVNGADWMHGYEPATGRELWRVEGSSRNTTPTPVVSDGVVYVTSGYRKKPIFALTTGGEVRWSLPKGGSYMTTPIVYGDHLYTLQNNGVLSCFLKSTGERVYQKRVAAGAFSASPIAADGRLYLVSEDGEVYVVRSGADYELLATNTLGEVAMATPAASPGMLLIRTQHRLWAFTDRTE